MNKIKAKIYFDLSQVAIKFYYWCEDRYWDSVGDKKTNTDRIVQRVAEIYDVPVDMIHSQGNNHKPKEKKNASQA